MQAGNVKHCWGRATYLGNLQKVVSIHYIDNYNYYEKSPFKRQELGAPPILLITIP